MINFTGVTELDLPTAGALNKTSLGAPRTVVFTFETDIALADINVLVARPSAWLNAVTLDSAVTIPTASCFELSGGGALALATPYSMTYVSSSEAQNNKNGTLSVTITAGGIGRILTFTWSFINIHDNVGILNNLRLINQDKLIKDARTNTNILDNSALDAYTSARDLRFSIWILRVSGTTEQKAGSKSEQIQFSKDYVTGAKTIESDICGVASDSTLELSGTTLTATFTMPMGATVIETYWLALKVQTEDYTLSMIDNYDINNKGFLGDLGTTFAAQNLANGGFWSAVTAYTGTETTATIGASLSDGDIYRFAVLVRYTVAGVYNWATIVSQEFTASECPCYVEPTILSRRLGDLNGMYAANITALPMERISSDISIDVSARNAAYPSVNFAATLKEIRVIIQTDNTLNPNIKHILTDDKLTRNAFNQFLPNPSNLGTFVIIPDYTNIVATEIIPHKYVFRILYDNRQCIANELNGVRSAGTMIQQWQDKSLLVRTIYTTDADVFEIQQTVNVYDFDPNEADQLLWLTDAQTVCEDDTSELLTIQNNGAINPFISVFTDGSSYVEHESFVPTDLDQLTNAAIIAQNADFLAANANISVNPSALATLGNLFYIGGIEKDDSCRGCNTGLTLYMAAQGLIDGYNMSSNYKDLVCLTVDTLQACGVWQLLDIVYFPMARTRNMGLVNWKNPGTFDLTPVNPNINDFVVNEGFRSVGNFYLDSGWNPVTDGVNYTVAGSSWAVMMRDMARATQYLHSCQIDPFPFPIGTLGSTTVLNQANVVGFAHDERLDTQFEFRPTTSQPLLYSFVGSSRTGIGAGGLIQHCFDGVFDAPLVSGLPQIIPNSDVVVNATRNTFTLAVVPDSTNKPVQFTMRGGYLTEAQMLCLYNAVEYFYNNLPLV